MNDLCGITVGRYHIIEPIGEGGMATVYKAFDTRLETDVAFKLIRKDALGKETADRLIKRFEREAKSLARLTHINIVKVTDYGEYEGSPYLVMPYLSGGTLKQLMGRPMPYAEAARMLAPIARALEYANQQSMIHRDVKPSNILITSSGDLILTDFGIAKLLEADESVQLTGIGLGVGTPEYMAPEQWLGKAGPASDQYGLGVVFYELVTGRKPYTAETPAAILLKQANDPLPRPRKFVPAIPDDVEKIILKSMAKKPENRFANIGDFASALEKLASQGNPNRSKAVHQNIAGLEPKTTTEPDIDHTVDTFAPLTSQNGTATKTRFRILLITSIVVFMIAILAVAAYLNNTRGKSVVQGSSTKSTGTATFIKTTEKSNILPSLTPTLLSKSTIEAPRNSSADKSVLFQEDFEDGSADGFINKVGLWHIVTDTSGNHIYEVDAMDSSNEWPTVEFGKPDWTDYVYEVNTRIVDYTSSNDAPLTTIYFRGKYKVAFTPYWRGFDLVYDPPWKVISSRKVPLSKNTWYTVRIEAKGSSIKVYLDGTLMIDETDQRSSSGLLGLGSWPNAKVQFDNILVKRIDTPTVTPIPATVAPSPSPSAVVQPTSSFIPGATVLYSTDFDDMTDFLVNWDIWENVTLTNGIVTIANKESGIGRIGGLGVGDGLLVLFRCTEGTDSNIVFFNNSSYVNKYIGIKPNFQNFLMTSIGNDNLWIGGQKFTGNLTLSTNIWYYGLVEIKPKGEFYMKVWNKDNPDQYREITMPMGEMWENERWYGAITTNQYNEGKIDVDSYQELQFIE